jgi:hypothetical protein
MTFVLELQTLDTPEGVDQQDLIGGGPYLQSDAGSNSCYGCSWLVGCSG